jgi:signal peptidase I
VTGLRVGRFFGVPVYLPTYGPIAIAVVTAGYTLLLTRLVPGVGLPPALLAGCCFGLLLTGSLLAHDLGHVAMCLRLRLPVRRVVISPLAAGADHADPRGPTEEYLVALAGPLVTLTLTGLGVTGASLTRSGTVLHAVLVLLSAANLLVLLFHLLPGLPADGGRIVRAAGWWWSGSWATGARLAAGLGRIVVGLIALTAMATLSTDDLAAAATSLAVAGGVGGLFWLGSAQALVEAGPSGAPGPPPPRSHRAGSARSTRARRGPGEWAALFVLVVVVTAGVHAFVAQTFLVTSGSMRDTLREGDRVLVDKASYRVREIRRGELVIFHRPPAVILPEKDLVKRVIGLPGDRVEGRNGAILVNGRRLAEPYLQRECGGGTGQIPPLVVPAGRLYVLGDNRCQSSDSRSFGPLDARLVEGRAVLILWPPSRAGSP